MTALSDFLRPGAVMSAMHAANKKTLFQALGALAERVHRLDERDVIERLIERERLGSTGFGGGIAIPHARIDKLPEIVGLFVRLDEPIDFDAVDDLPVDIVFMLLSPPDSGADHLKALARVSRALRDRNFVAKLRGAGSDDALWALFATNDARDAA